MASQFKQLANNATTTTNTDLSTLGKTTVTTAAGEGSKLPQPGNGYYLTFWNGATPGGDPNREIVTVTARSGDVLTHTPTAKTHTSPCNIGVLDTKDNILDIQAAVNVAENNIATLTTGQATLTSAQATTNGNVTALAGRVTTLENNGGGGGGGGSATAALNFVAAVATANVNLASSTVITIDGYTLNATDLVLLTGQTNPAQNGLYSVGSGTAPNTWTRPSGFTDTTVVKGWMAIVMNGTAYFGSQWLLLTPTAGVVVGTDSQTWGTMGIPAV